MTNSNHLKLRDKLNKVSPSFCLAKWYQVTIHLQNGQTHSCHHPNTHQVPLEELKTNPSALHNTNWKKLQRKSMLTGVRPPECEYCWKIEDSHPDSISDRTLKSSESWALPNFDEAANSSWDYNPNPRYVEVSFGHACNFKCMYCAPHISSSIMGEYLEHGHYAESPQFSIENLKKSGQMPIPKDDPNPYVEAFWKWWPELKKDLQHFRITGGEPLINPNTFKFLDYIVQNPMPNLHFAINSNLGIPDQSFERFLNSMKLVLEKKMVKSFEFYTSVDTHGAQAEYIRNGLNYNKYMQNVRKFLTQLPSDTKLIFMCTYNALSVTSFKKFIDDVVALKKEFMMPNRMESRVILDLPYLKDPSHLSLAVLTDDFSRYIKSDLDYIKKLAEKDSNQFSVFTEYEVNKMQRVYNWFNSLSENADRRNKRRAFGTFIDEYDKRKKTDFSKVFPELIEFKKLCHELYVNNTDLASP